MTQFLKYYLPAFLLCYLLITFVVPSIRVYKQTGTNPLTFRNSESAHDFIGAIMKVITGLLVVAILLFSFNTYLYRFLHPFYFLQTKWLKYAGLLLIHASLIWIVIAQYNMKLSWRIGIDKENKTELITTGLFGLSRNPVFLGMIGSTGGIYLIIPDAITFFAAATTYIILQIQIRLEEEHLNRIHGTVYHNYKTRVRRLL